MTMDKIPAEYLGIEESAVDALQWIAYLKDEATGKCYVIPPGEWKLGRKDDDMSGYPEGLSIDIPIVTDDCQISRYQADIKLRKNIMGEYSLFICDSIYRKNRTRVGGFETDGTFEYQLFDNIVVRMGITRFTVRFRPTL